MDEVLKGNLHSLDGQKRTLIVKTEGKVKTLPLNPNCKLLGPKGTVLQGLQPLSTMGLYAREACPIVATIESGQVTRIELPAPMAKMLIRSVTKPSTTSGWIGKPIPNLTLHLTDGRVLDQKCLQGKVVLLDFWATWCGPCQKIPPVMQRLHARYGNQGVLVVGTNCSQKRGDSRAVVSRYATRHGYQYPFAYGADALSRTLGIQSIPMLVLLDRRGIVRFVQEGLLDNLETVLAKQIEALL
jgi:thiol-disulfide isomerase/thioredoxin